MDCLLCLTPTQAQTPPLRALFDEIKSNKKTKTKHEFLFRITYATNKSAILAHGTEIVHNGSIISFKSLNEVTQSRKIQITSLLEEVEVPMTVQDSVLWKKLKVGETFGSMTEKNKTQSLYLTKEAVEKAKPSAPSGSGEKSEKKVDRSCAFQSLKQPRSPVIQCSPCQF